MPDCFCSVAPYGRVILPTPSKGEGGGGTPSIRHVSTRIDTCCPVAYVKSGRNGGRLPEKSESSQQQPVESGARMIRQPQRRVTSAHVTPLRQKETGLLVGLSRGLQRLLSRPSHLMRCPPRCRGRIRIDG
ncbi:hypothetical protein JTE90_016772 [Oedothorax gibbosus]|uniref:Uncharacterized protein n=1 Tax=Oedothorax gibbosus TaxID=931172 RepID=A0AAV6VZ10_9ARAC|nr:hypothetical protein JTE90_016772 [Oedothorax gibbosus]